MTAAPAGNRPWHWIGSRLQRQFSVIAALLIVVTSSLFLLLVAQQYKSSILKAHETASLNVNMLLQAALENAMIKRDLDGLQDIVTRLGAQEGITGVMIANPGGEIRFSSYPDRLFQPLADHGLGAALASRTRQTGFRSLDSGQQVLRSINPVANQERCQGCHGEIANTPVNGLLIVDYDASGTRAEVRRGVLMLAGLGVAVLILLEVGLWIALKRLVLRRINRMTVTTRALASGDLSVRTRPQGADELASLGRDFNHMADRLEANLKSLQTAHSALQRLIDAIPDGVRVIGPDFRIIMANTAYCRQIGAPMADVVGQFCYRSSHRRDSPCLPTLVECPVASILHQGGDNLTCNHVHRDLHGSDMLVELSAAAVTIPLTEGPTRCVVESIRDLDSGISISQKQRLAEMGSLAAGIAHEVHNPLSSICLALRFLKTQPNQSEEMQDYIQIAETEIDNCIAITESLLRLSALPDQESELVNMADVIGDTVSLIRFEAEQRGVDIQTRIDGTPALLARDSNMRNLVFNLTLNAIHAMPEGGTLTISCHAEGEQVKLEVRDTGVGISERDQAKIFLPFWTRRADASKGRGLGLAICASIVKTLGGTITCQSVVGVGTRFRVTLPQFSEGDHAP